MIILAVDTASRACSVALSENDTLRYEYVADHGGTHAVKLAGMIDEVLCASGIPVSEIDGFAVSVGPGSFTGLRIGIATVKGLAFAASKPVVPISSLEALAYQGGGGYPVAGTSMLICPFLDARKNEIYTATYRRTGDHMETVMLPRVVSPEWMLANITERCLFIGSGALLYREMIEARLGNQACIASSEMNLLRASTIARLGYAQLKKHAGTASHDVLPVYIRRSEAEKKLMAS